jgi:uncharacterized protein with HEPN domain
LRDDRERLRDISEAIENIEKYVSIGYQAFVEDERMQVWIIHHLIHALRGTATKGSWLDVGYVSSRTDPH